MVLQFLSIGSKEFKTFGHYNFIDFCSFLDLKTGKKYLFAVLLFVFLLSKGVKKFLKVDGSFWFLNLKTKIAVSYFIRSDNLNTFNLL